MRTHYCFAEGCGFMGVRERYAEHLRAVHIEPEDGVDTDQVIAELVGDAWSPPLIVPQLPDTDRWTRDAARWSPE